MRIPESAPPFEDLFSKISQSSRLGVILSSLSKIATDSTYFHWDDLKYRKVPEDLSREEWWTAIKLHRQGLKKTISLLDKESKPFSYGIPDRITELLHQIDRDGGTLIQIPEPIANPAERDRYLLSSLMEEAITSSQLEGAATTREVARRMLAEGRAPRDRSEKMILNNYITMRRIIDLKKESLTPGLVLEIHRRISDDTLDIADGAGRLRRPEEKICVSDLEGQIFHNPPEAVELAVRLQTMCDFANGKTPAYFIHPVVRAIILHFWLAYDHPFVDGNGRTARALFYWQMLHAGYWLFEFVSISQIIRKAPVKYGMAFLQTETDDNDLTYFILHQTEVIRSSLQELHDYVLRKSKETRASISLLGSHIDLNYRQQSVLSHAIRHPNFRYSIAGHMGSQGIVYDTARTDLLALARLGFLEQGKSGKALVFIAPVDLVDRLGRK